MVDQKAHRPFEIVEYDSNWVQEFKVKKRKLIQILGDNILDIQHVGSTSIPGMLAKPQIDILVVVKNLDAVRDKYREMSVAGFTSLGDYTSIGEEYFTEDKERIRLTSVHVVPQGHPEILEVINFRNYLRTHVEDRDQYIAVKRELFSRYSQNYAAYGRGKEEIIRAIKHRANQWAEEQSRNQT